MAFDETKVQKQTICAGKLSAGVVTERFVVQDRSNTPIGYLFITTAYDPSCDVPALSVTQTYVPFPDNRL